MSDKNNTERFRTLGYKDFQRMAQDPTLSPYEKIGFPDAYREGKEWDIWQDIQRKMPAFAQRGATLMDIGCGCSDLVGYLIEHTRTMEQHLILLDSAEMLALVPDAPHITKIAGFYPKETPQIWQEYAEKVDGILLYSVFHYTFVEDNIYQFIDRTMQLLRAGGQFLIGDIPNASKRRRFFATPTGIAFHQAYTQSTTLPPAHSFDLQSDQIDDGVLFGILQRYRNAGHESYLLPQSSALPMSNRREDLLICKV